MDRRAFVVALALTAALTAMPLAAQSAPAGTVGHPSFRWQGTLAPRASNSEPLRWADYPVVAHVFTGSPAERAGLRKGDLVLSVNGIDGTDPAAYRDRPLGGAWRMIVQRGAREIEVVVPLTEITWKLDEFVPSGAGSAPPGR